ncbi:MAG: antitoxin [Hydrogenovibrio sp.]|uniref:type II toxin-antitoxin system Phd/YefM family antitoxin n=1 Tax=Hydrogenovibrio sp. TaxID=2065821 RepID=UPI002870AFF0|nr:antitoxin [Hydrogenovibrio sp.]MDR9498930.1 antitoxin [Hydrogenovibrio sp.]
MNTHTVLTPLTTSISELKKNPMGILEAGQGQPVAVLNRNQPAFYCIPSESYEALLDKLEDMELALKVHARANEEEIDVELDDL